jgi:molybdopterin converting factor small subunit
MTVTVHILLESMQSLGGKNIEIIVPEGTDVKSLICGMAEIWGDSLSPHIFRPGTDQLLPDIRVMVNGQNIGVLHGLDTLLKDGDEVLLLPLAAGG